MGQTQENGAVAPTEATAIVISQEATLESYRRGLEPTGLKQAYELAATIAATGICQVKTPEDALIRLVYGRELGFTAMQSIAAIYVVDGRPGLWAEVMEALCTQHPDCEEWKWLERSDTCARLRVKRKNRDAIEVQWTIEDARNAQLLDRGNSDDSKKKSNWNRYPRRMLTARCRSEAAGLMFPDAIRGMKSPEELMDEPPLPPPVPGADELARAREKETLYEKTKADLFARMETIKGPADLRAFRAEFETAKEKGVIAGPWADAVSEVYNARFVKKKAATAAEPPAPAEAAPATPPASDPSPAQS